MNNLETQSNENHAQLESPIMPLFNQNVIPQTPNNVVPQISNPLPPNPSNVEPQNTLKSNNEKPISENLIPPIKEHSDSAATNNEEPHQEENVDMANLKKSGIKKKSLKKSAKKKKLSQKRDVVPLKFFVLSGEKVELKIKAKERGLSLSNYIRMSLALPPNSPGRKQSGKILSIDLGLDIE